MPEPVTSPLQIDERLHTINDRLDRSTARMDAIEAALRANTAATLEGNRDAREMLELFQAVKGGFKVLGWIGAVARWAGYLVTAGVAIYAGWHSITHGGQLPPKP